MTKLDPATAAGLRLESLRIAQKTFDDCKDADLVMSAAREYTDFVLGTNDAEIVRAAQDLAKKVK